MSPARLGGVAARLLSACLLAAACERSAPVARHDSAEATLAITKDSTVAPTSANAWNDSAGSVLIVPGETSGDAVVILAREDDSTQALGLLAKVRRDVVLFGRNGARWSGQLGSAAKSTDAVCRVWPVQHSDANGWALGFISGNVVPIALDSLEGASARDSATLTTEAARLASAVTAITSPSFEGLRFSVHEVRRFTIARGVQALVAHVIRRVNQEANPQEEQTLIIAERDSGATTGPYRLVYADRAHGLEEQVVAPEVIAAVVIAGRPTLVVARDSEDGVAYEFLERDAPRHWRVRWISAPTRCG